MREPQFAPYCAYCKATAPVGQDWSEDFAPVHFYDGICKKRWFAVLLTRFANWICVLIVDVTGESDRRR